jgi:purine-binding chemotaxis protein CheW
VIVGERQSTLLCRVRERLCALPLAHVVETMRPLPIEPLGGMPGFVQGIAIIRGAPVPVVDAGALLGSAGAARILPDAAWLALESSATGGAA